MQRSTERRTHESGGVARAQRTSVGEPPASACLSEDDVLAYANGATSETWREQLHRHLDDCEACRLLVQSTIADESLDAGGPPASLSEVLAAKALMTFSPGQSVAGRYRIESFIGKGGMGEVYSAIDQLLGTRVALKTVLCTAGDDPRAVRKLIDEVRHAEAITHPNVCRIQALFEHRDPAAERPPVPFFTMEFIEGETLAARCKRGRLELGEVRSIARQLLEGLKAAHAKGVRHLDFKSDNVMLREGSHEAVVMDFGLSRDQKARSRTSEHQGWMGTLPYMALEQLEGRSNLSASVDVYAFGVVVYEMLTGELPFRGPSPGAMILKQLRERPAAPSQRRPELSAEVDAFVQRCLRSSPDERFVDAAVALAAFDDIRRWERRGLVLSPGARKATLAAGLVIAAGALVAIGASVSASPTIRSPQPTPEASIGRLQAAPNEPRGMARATATPAPEANAATVPPSVPPGESTTAPPATTHVAQTATSDVASEPTPASSPAAPGKSAASASQSSTPALATTRPRATKAAPEVAAPPTSAPSPAAADEAPTPRGLKHVPRRPLPLEAKSPALDGHSAPRAPGDASEAARVGEPGQAPTTE